LPRVFSDPQKLFSGSPMIQVSCTIPPYVVSVMKPASMVVLHRKHATSVIEFSAIQESPAAYAPRGSDSLPRVSGLLEGGNCLGLIVFYIEDGVELCDLQKVMHLLGQVQQL
jgi:hypothetical protein